MVSILEVDRSWLYHMSTVLDEAGIPYIYQARQERFPDNTEFTLSEDFVIVSPINEWTPDQDDGVDILEAKIRVGVVTSQEPGAVLTAHTRNLETQQVIENALFGPERFLSGYATGAKRFAMNLYTFDENGTPTLKRANALEYGRGVWTDKSPEFENTRVWTIQTIVTVTL